ncbi:PAS domain-containing protein [Omnitrophica bacterium]|nr:PAS domain-containing protein [Candidatus Omnitrophota bacterium]
MSQTKKSSTNGKKLSQQELLHHAINASMSAITIADAQKKNMPLIYANKTFEKNTGYSSKEIIGQNCRILQGKDRDQPGISKIREAIAQKGSCAVQLRNYRKDGTPFWNELRMSPVFDEKGKLTHYIGVQTDISDRVRAEKELEDHRNHLEELVRERTQKLQEKNVALQEILSQIELEKKKVKDQVVENVDAVMIPLLKKMKDRLPENAKKYADMIEKNLEDLTSAFGVNIARKLYKLTPREIEISNMIRSGLSSKDIAAFFHVSISTIENQRNTIRKKLGISKRRVNLVSYLQAL